MRSGRPVAKPGDHELVIVHDYLNDYGGAERVIAILTQLFPTAPLFTTVFNRSVMRGLVAEQQVNTSFLQAFARTKSATKLAFAILPLVFSNMRIPPTRVVMSSSSGFAHHIRAPKGSFHVCYCYTPPRFLWQPEVYFRGNGAVRRALTPLLAQLRRLDREAAARVDRYVAISTAVAHRIKSIYSKEAVVVFPPVETARFQPSSDRSKRFLVVSRLLGYKRIDIAVDAATRYGFPLDVIGDGPERRALKRIAGPTVRFLGFLPDAAVRQAMSSCTALILPGAEDFGLTAVEVQASGRPVIAFAEGGALDTVSDHESGFLFREQNADHLAASMTEAERTQFDPTILVAAAKRFDVAVFRESLASVFASVSADRRR